MADLTAEATFTNPTPASQFQYGFVIRDRVEIWVSSEGTWQVVASERRDYPQGGEGASRFVVVSTAEGILDVPFDISPSGKNHVRVNAEGGRVCLVVNGEAVECVDLPEFTMAGEVLISSKYGFVPYRGFKVAELQEAG